MSQQFARAVLQSTMEAEYLAKQIADGRLVVDALGNYTIPGIASAPQSEGHAIGWCRFHDWKPAATWADYAGFCRTNGGPPTWLGRI